VALAGVLALSGVLVMPAPARAQPVATDIYSDVKEIVEELITREVAENVTAKIACYTRAGLGKYYARSLQLVYERNLGAVRSALKRDTLDLLANYAFASLQEGRAISLGDFLPTAELDPTDPNDKCVKELKDLGGPESHARGIADRARRLSKTPYKPLEACDNLGPEVKPKLELPCQLVAAVLAAAEGRKADSVERLSRALALIVFWKLSDQLLSEKQRLEQSLKQKGAAVAHPEEVERAKTLNELVGQVRQGGKGENAVAQVVAPVAAPPPADGGKAKPKTLRAKAASAAKATRVGPRRSAQRALLERLAADIHVVFTKGSLPADGLLSSIAKLGTEEVLSRVGKAMPISVDGKAVKGDVIEILKQVKDADLTKLDGEGQSAAVARALLRFLGASTAGTIRLERADSGEFKFTTGAPGSKNEIIGSGLMGLDDLLSAARHAAQLEALLGAWVPDAAGLLELARVLVRTAEELETMAASLRQLHNARADGIDILGFLERLAEAGLTRSCEPVQEATRADGNPIMAPTLCDFVTQTTGILDRSGHLRRVLVAALDGDHRTVAVESVRAAFSPEVKERICCGNDDAEACQRNIERYGRFAATFVSYMLAPRPDGSPDPDARGALKEATIDVLRIDTSNQAGYEREWWEVYVPTFSLRTSWNSGYLNEGTNGRRYVATVDWPVIRGGWQSRMLYVGVQGSIFEVLGPFSEFALRDSRVDYAGQDRVFLNWITPRVEFLVATPLVSRKVAISAGVGVRTVVPLRNWTQDPTTPGEDYTYATWFKDESAVETHDKVRFYRAVEFSLAVKYLP
jgi:hypothetical protein